MDIAEHSEEIEREQKAYVEDMERRAKARHKQKDEAESKRNPLKVKGERDAGQKKFRLMRK